MIDPTTTKLGFKKELAAAKTPEAYASLRLKYLGRKQGILTHALHQLPTLKDQEKRKLGPQLNELRKFVDTQLQAVEEKTKARENTTDLTLPPESKNAGHLHPITQVQAELETIFSRMGFSLAFGPEIETDWYNFTALNIPDFHPARDMWDTFYLKSGFESKKSKIQIEKLLLRTHTSPAQVRYLQTHVPPCAVIMPGRVFRHEATDITHEHTFEQLEGLVVGSDITFGNMVWTIERVLKDFFGEQAKIQLRPSFFPFVEPGAEVALSHPHFKNGDWVEILGCGMVHQSVFRAAGLAENTYQGFAFGFGLTRFAAMKYGIPDIRMFAENQLSFLEQF